MKQHHPPLAQLLLLLLVTSAPAQAPDLINYQGRLVQGTNLVNGAVELTLSLYDASTAGSLLYADSNTVTVVDGLYSTYIGDATIFGDLDSALTNAQVWLEAVVNGSTLSPRERLVSVPYARSVQGLRVAAGNSIVLNPEHGNMVDATTIFSAIGGGLINTIQENASFSTIGGGGANRIMTNATLATIGGGEGNTIQENASYSTIGGGLINRVMTNALLSAIGGGEQNSIGEFARNATIGGGGLNTIQENAAYSTIGGGEQNSIREFSDHATVGGGRSNVIRETSPFSTIGGGEDNSIESNSWWAAIGGGLQNSVGAYYAVIGGGANNEVQPNAGYSMIGAGRLNQIGTNAAFAFIGGGQQNSIGSGAAWATIPGGRNNRVGTNAANAFAAGRQARANHPGTFVWGDDNAPDFASTASNQFLIRAGGGVGVNVNNPQAPLHVAGDAIIGQQANAPRFGMAAVVLSAASGVLFQHPIAPLSLTWAHSTRTLTFTNGLAPNEYVDASIRLTEEPGASTHATADLNGGTTLSVTDSSGQGAAWHVIAVREDAAGPGLTFQGAGYNDGVSGLVTYWY